MTRTTTTPQTARELLEGRTAQVNMLTEHFRRLSRDWHDRSTRPCPTCDPISRIIGEPFGCAAFRIEETERKQRRAALAALDDPVDSSIPTPPDSEVER